MLAWTPSSAQPSGAMARRRLAGGGQNAFNTFPDESARAVRRREIQRVHAVGLQRRLLLRTPQLRLGPVARTVMIWALPAPAD